MMKSMMNCLAVVLAVSIISVGVSAQQGGRRRGGPDNDRPMMGQGMEQRKYLEQLRMLKMLELLDLNKEQEVPFLTAFNGMREDMRGLEEQTRGIIDSLATELHNRSANESRVKNLTGRVKELDRRRYERLNAFVDQAEKMLTAEQFGKLVIFQKRFEAELLEQVGRFRRGMHGPGGPDTDEPGMPEGEG